MREVLSALTLIVSLGAASAGAQERPVRTVKDGMLDEIKLYVDKLPPATRVVMRQFSATDDDLVKGEKKDETKTMQADGPRMLGERFAVKLKELGPFTDVSVLDASGTAPGEALLVEGKFTELDPGSRASPWQDRSRRQMARCSPLSSRGASA